MDEKKAAQFKRQNDFNKKAYDRTTILTPKGKKGADQGRCRCQIYEPE